MNGLTRKRGCQSSGKIMYRIGKRHASNVSVIDTLVGNVKKWQKSKCFSKGWGDPQLLAKILALAAAVKGGDKSYRSHLVNDQLDIHFTKPQISSSHSILHGKFRSPAEEYLPEESKWSYFQLITPNPNPLKAPIPLCFHYPATGDDGYFYRRTMFAMRLIKKGIASLIIENPFYGARRPKEQSGCTLSYVTDIMSIAIALVGESHSLSRYFTKGMMDGVEYGPIIYTGMSMGGHMASIVGVESPDPVGIVPCLSPYSASPVFTKGVLSHWVDWSTLSTSLPHYLPPHLSSMTTEEFLGELLESVSDLRNFGAPQIPQAAIQVSAKYDAYVPGTGDVLQRHWPGSKLYWIEQGHVGGFLTNPQLIVNSIVESCEALKEY